MSGSYDEFSFLHENASEFGLPWDRPPVVQRVTAQIDSERSISALRWGSDDPTIVLLHGGGQNAHTWDTVALALGGDLLALDLPGHGHSDGPGSDEDIISGYAADVGAAIDMMAPHARTIVGMSAGGLTAIVLCGFGVKRFDRLMLVDILPGPDPIAAKAIADFLKGPERFASLDAMIARAQEFNPGRSPASIRRGVTHNAVEMPDGQWQWRHQRHRRVLYTLPPEVAERHNERLWQELASSPQRLALVRGMAKGSVVTDVQESRLRAIRPGALIHLVAGAGHSVQGDRPLELAALIDAFAKRRT